MEAYAFYLFKSSVWLTGFSLIYFAFLRNERFFLLNRIFLITGILTSLLLPLVTLHYTVEIPIVHTTQDFTPQVPGVVSQSPAELSYSWLWVIYLTGIIYLVFRVIKQTAPVLNMIRKSETQNHHSVKLIRTDRFPASFSFFSFVFVNPSINDIETSEIVNHESEHIRQKHWIDLLLYEALCLVQWVNPVVWLYGRMIRQNHEYLADQRALQRSANPALYRAALLNQMFGGPVIQLANSFNYSLNKKRFNMMTKKISSPLRKLRLLFILPFIAGVLYAFATPEYKFIRQNEANTTVPQKTTEKIVRGKVVSEDGTPLKSASVIVSGKTVGTITDANGNFELKLTEDSPLVFSYVGYVSQKVTPDFEKEMLITLKKEVIGIDAMGNDMSPDHLKKNPLILIDGKKSTKAEMKKLDPKKIGSMSVLKDKKAIEKYGAKGENGVIEITLKSALDNSNDQSFKIRTNSPLNFGHSNGTGSPLYVIDGKISGEFEANKIDPQNIKSISVLKNASATALYGEKGKNGVVLITLKSNVALKTNKFEFKANQLTIHSDSASKSENSVGLPRNPIYVVDGKIIDNRALNKIDPNSVDKIDVLKGKPAIDLYGEKGKNGAVLITLKEGKESPDKTTHPKKIASGHYFAAPSTSTLSLNRSSSSEKENDHTFFIVENMPRFPGGTDALNSFFATTLKYPKEALEKGIQGQVFVNFIIDKDGSVSNAKVVRSVDPSLDAEALRIIKTLPKWNPGVQDGKPVKVSFTVPIDFELPANLPNKEKLALKSGSTQANSATKKNFEDQQAQSNKLTIVPNPAKNKATVTLQGSDSNSKLAVSILDVNGNLIKKEIKNGPTFRLSLAGFAPGTYLITVSDGTTQYSGQLVVNR